MSFGESRISVIIERRCNVGPVDIMPNSNGELLKLGVVDNVVAMGNFNSMVGVETSGTDNTSDIGVPGTACLNFAFLVLLTEIFSLFWSCSDRTCWIMEFEEVELILPSKEAKMMVV